MEIFDQQVLSTIPKNIRYWIMIFLVLLAILSMTFVAYLVSTNASDSAISVVLEIFKASAIGSAIWFFFLVSQKAKSRKDLLIEVSKILNSEVPESFFAYAAKMPPFNLYGFNSGKKQKIPEKANTEIQAFEVSHSLGTTYARYRMRSFDKLMTMYIQLNVKRMSVIYYLPPDLAPHFDEMFNATSAGAKEAGWIIKNYGVHKSEYFETDGFFAEFAALRDLGDDFLYNPIERLFICNDLAAMTRNVILTWSRFDKKMNDNI